MVSLIKNQIIKHLSVFAKNLKPDQISLEVLSGTGELRNIVLNEDVLAEKLELPPFLKIRRAECNRLKVKIPWTKLNSSPVKIIIDELTVALELGPGKATDPPKKTAVSTSYGFADRVVEGLSLKINVVDISFESESFSGSLWLSPLVVESKNPLWQDVNNLKKSRLSDPSCHQVIFFKQVAWNLMKIQAFAHARGNSDRGKRLNSPLRLITQGGKCRIAIKKDSNDGSLLAGRIQMIFDDIHWVATLAEIRSFIAFQKHIVSLAKASSQVSDNPFLVDYSAKSRSQQRTIPNPAIKSTIFKQFDVGQTSHHVYINKVYLTLIDDSSIESDYPENWNIKSGAIQVTLEKIAIDFYLQNIISDERRYWVRYSTPNSFTAFCGNELDRYLTTLSIGMDPNARDRLNRLWSTLTSQTLVIRIDDVIIECVSEQSTKRDDLQDVYTSKTSAKFAMPQNTPSFHFEFSSYFFPGSTTPEPPPNHAHIILGPGNCLIDNRTIRWLLYVVDNISRTLDIEDTSVDNALVCARIDLLMPKLIIPCPQVNDARFPERFVVNVSTVTVSNRALENETFSIENIFQQLKDDNIGFISRFEGQHSEELRSHVLQTKQVATELATNGATLDLLPTRWYLSTSPLWIEAVLPAGEPGTKGLNGLTVVSDIMLAGCIDAKLPNIYLAIEPLNSLNVVVDHFQFLQFMRVQKSIGDLLEQIEFDKKFFADKNGVPVSDSPLALYCFCHEINVSVILPVGLAPSPYDLNSFVKSDTVNSLSSGWSVYLDDKKH
uniref:Chorein N-terminal domain-containing protein n=1 Tax=Panagrolaimus sp. JU765 TaxID=591449 RepID=A0AC34RQ42_9BILA